MAVVTESAQNAPTVSDVAVKPNWCHVNIICRNAEQQIGLKKIVQVLTDCLQLDNDMLVLTKWFAGLNCERVFLTIEKMVVEDVAETFLPTTKRLREHVVGEYDIIRCKHIGQRVELDCMLAEINTSPF